MSTLDGHYQPLIERYLDRHYNTQAFALDWLVFKGEVQFWSQVICEDFDLFFRMQQISPGALCAWRHNRMQQSSSNLRPVQHPT